MTAPTAPHAPAKPRLLFAAYMAGGNATILQNLQDAIAGRPDVDSAWLPVEMDRESQVLGREPRARRVVPGTIRNSMITGDRIRALEAAGGRFHAAWFFQQTICMFLWRFRRRVPYVVAMDGTPLWYLQNELYYSQPRFDPRALVSRVKHRLTRRVYEGAFHLLPLSWSVRRSLVEDYGIPEERVTVAPPGINLRRYACPDRRERPAGGPLKVLFVGADFARKGGDLLLRLAADPEFRELEFHLVTRSFQGTPEPNVRVHAALTTNSDEMVRLFREADLYVLPTRADSHAIATLEAMAMGLPVVTTPVGGVPDVVEEGTTGYLVPKDDLGALADRVRRLAGDPALRLRMGLAGRRRVEERFDAEAIAARVVELLKQAAASRP